MQTQKNFLKKSVNDMGYTSLSRRLFGSIANSLEPYFEDLKMDLQKANMNYTLEEYLSKAIFTIFLAFIAESALLSFILSYFIEPFMAIISSIILCMGISAGLFFMFYSYPATISSSRRNKIKKILPFSTSYMATIASSNLPPISIFRTLAKFKDYGEISNEAANIVRDVDVFGMSVNNAIKKQAKRTPSKEFAELLWGINNVATSGADMAMYLKQKSNEMMNEYKRRIEKYSQDLSLYVEIYLTLIITGSIFFVVLSSVISAISGGLEVITIQSFIVFILLPLISIGFLVLVKSISPTE